VPPDRPLRPVTGRRLRRLPGLPLAAALVLVMGAAGAGLASPGDAVEDPTAARGDLQDLEAELHTDRQALDALVAEEQALEADVADLTRRLVELGSAMQARESALAELDRSLADLEAREGRLLDQLHQLTEGRAQALASMQRLAMTPRAALLFSPGGPTDTVRSGLLLGAVYPRLEEEADALSGTLDDLLRLRRSLAQEREESSRLTVALSADRTRLDQVLEERRERLSATMATRAQAAARVRQMAEEAEDLRDLVTRLERDARAAHAARQAELMRQAADAREALAAAEAAVEAEAQRRIQAGLATATPVAAAEPTALAAAATAVATATPLALALPLPDIPDVPGDRLLLPVSGHITQGFREGEAFGAPSQGIVIRSRPAATVIAPRAGRVAFAGDYRLYGTIVIIDHGDRRHSLIIGLGGLYVSAGQNVVAGEPVGELPTLSAGTTQVYFEYQQRGSAVNPLTLLATAAERDRG